MKIKINKFESYEIVFPDGEIDKITFLGLMERLKVISNIIQKADVDVMRDVKKVQKPRKSIRPFGTGFSNLIKDNSDALTIGKLFYSKDRLDGFEKEEELKKICAELNLPYDREAISNRLSKARKDFNISKGDMQNAL